MSFAYKNSMRLACWALSTTLFTSCQSEVLLTGLTGSSTSDSTATSDNTAGAVVKRDGSGNFSAGAITATVLESGTLKVTGGTPANGKVLTSDASGNATWQTLAGTTQWTTTGSDISFASGKVSIGTATAGQTLTVDGRIETKGGMLFNQGSAGTDNLIYVGSTSSGKVNASFGFMAAGMGSGDENDGPYFLARGNSYTASAVQRGNLYLSAGIPTGADAREGSINFFSNGAKHMVLDNAGNFLYQTGTNNNSIPDTAFEVRLDRSYASINFDSNGAVTSPLSLMNNGGTNVGSGTQLSFRAKTTNTTNKEFGAVGSVTTNNTFPNSSGDLYFSTLLNETLSEKMRITSSGNVGIGTSTASTLLSLNGTGANQTIGMERETTANTAGRSLTIQAGGAKSGSTDLSGGDLYLNSGISTGSNGSNIYFNTALGSQAGGTADRLPSGNLGTISGGYRSVAFGLNSEATGIYSTAMGYNMKASGDGSFGISLAQNPGYFLTANNTMAVMGGTVGIENLAPSTLLHVGSATTTSGTTVATFENAGGTCSVTPNTAGAISCTSDERLKEKMEPVSGEFALDRLLKLQTKTYQFRADKSGQRHTGYIAQELQKVGPEFVRKGEDGNLQVFYSGLIPWITEGIKALHGKLTGVDSRVQALEAENKALKAYLCGKDPQAPICRK